MKVLLALLLTASVAAAAEPTLVGAAEKGDRATALRGLSETTSASAPATESRRPDDA